jgi:hypothetical protein
MTLTWQGELLRPFIRAQLRHAIQVRGTGMEQAVLCDIEIRRALSITNELEFNEFTALG